MLPCGLRPPSAPAHCPGARAGSPSGPRHGVAGADDVLADADAEVPPDRAGGGPVCPSPIMALEEQSTRGVFPDHGCHRPELL